MGRLRQRLEKRLGPSSDGKDGQLQVTVGDDAQGRLFDGNATVSMPTATLVGTHEDAALQTASDGAGAHLLRRLERHLARARGDMLRRKRLRMHTGGGG